MVFSMLVAFCLIVIGQNYVFGDRIYGEKLPDGTAFWSYHGSTGPDFWCNLDPAFKQCCKAHKRESPIDIRIADTEFPAYRIHFANYDIIPESMDVQNTGHTLRVNYKSDIKPYLTYHHNGEDRQFILDHIHFHWGSKSTEGSEHTVNHRHFPMEMHLLHKAPEHDTLFTASQHPESFAVIAVLFHHSPFHNIALDHVIRHFREAKYEGDDTAMQPFLLSNLLYNVHDFFTYNGSLTTPPCSDNVRWILLKHTMPVSESQLNAFRQLQRLTKVDDPNDDAPMVDNFRPTQSISGRSVLRSHFDDSGLFFPIG